MSVDDEKLQHIKDELDKLTDDERMELFCRYCRFCGNKDKGCVCWNDE